MRRRCPAVATVAVGAALCALGPSACGGGSASTRSVPVHSLNDLRGQAQRIMDRRLAKFGASKSQIACVDRVIETSSLAGLQRRVEQGDARRPPRPHKPPAQVAGALAGDCF